jgi:hypothetical protein
MIQVKSVSAFPWRVVRAMRHVVQIGEGRVSARSFFIESRHATRAEALAAMDSANRADEKARKSRRAKTRYMAKELLIARTGYGTPSPAMLFNSID